MLHFMLVQTSVDLKIETSFPELAAILLFILAVLAIGAASRREWFLKILDRIKPALKWRGDSRDNDSS